MLNREDVSGIPARMYLRGPRKGIKHSVRVFSLVSPSPYSAVGHPDGNVAGDPILFPLSVWT
jgi:hypothetical protein